MNEPYSPDSVVPRDKLRLVISSLRIPPLTYAVWRRYVPAFARRAAFA